MDDLVQFLRARLDEDEELAKQAAESGSAPQWDSNADPLLRAALGTRRRLAAQGVEGALADAAEAHAARHDPARVLRRVEADRQIVRRHDRAVLRAGGGARYFATETVCRSCEPNLQFPELSWPCPTLRLLALEYDDHPDYRPEWRP